METNNDHAGIVEPYEFPVTEPELQVESIDVSEPETNKEKDEDEEPRPVSSPSEIDLSGYQYDIVPTYKMIEDPDDQDTLFRIQFLQAFGITNDEYHPEIVSAVINDLYERYKDHNGIRGILESHPLYNSGIVSSSHPDTDTDPDPDTYLDPDMNESPEKEVDECSPSQSSYCIVPKDNNSEMIFCMMFSFQLFDLFHQCLRHAKLKEDIPKTLRDEIVECFRTMF